MRPGRLLAPFLWALTQLAFPSPFVAPALAAQLGGVQMPDAVDVNGKYLLLNGLGMREATMFKVKVYVGALYLENRSADASAILGSRQAKKIVLHFIREVDADKIKSTWREEFAKNCGNECDRLKPALERMLGQMAKMREGDEMSFTFPGGPDQVEVQVKGAPPKRFEEPSFGQILLLTWLGPNPPNGALKEGMLGKK